MFACLWIAFFSFEDVKAHFHYGDKKNQKIKLLTCSPYFRQLVFGKA